MDIVKNLNTLKAMQKQGFIKFCDQTGKKITGLNDNIKKTCYYIYGEAEGQSRYFSYKKENYKVEYVSGCFFPFVAKIE